MNAEEDNIKKLIILKCTSCEEMTWERTNNYRESHRIYLFIPSTKPPKYKRETSLRLSPVLADRDHDEIVYGSSTSQQVSRWKRLRLSWKSILTFHYSFSFFFFRKEDNSNNIEQKKCMWNMKPNASDGRLFFSALQSSYRLFVRFLYFPSQLYLDKKKPKLWGRAI